MNTDIFYEPADVSLRTEQKTRRTSGIAGGKYGSVSTTQTGLIAATSNGGAGFTAIIYPRVKSEPPPVVTDLAAGKVTKVQSAAGTELLVPRLGAVRLQRPGDFILWNGWSRPNPQQRGKPLIRRAGQPYGVWQDFEPHQIGDDLISLTGDNSCPRTDVGVLMFRNYRRRQGNSAYAQLVQGLRKTRHISWRNVDVTLFRSGA